MNTNTTVLTVPADEVREGDIIFVAGVEIVVGEVVRQDDHFYVYCVDKWTQPSVGFPKGGWVQVRRPAPDAALLAKMTLALPEHLPGELRRLIDAMRAAGITVELECE